MHLAKLFWGINKSFVFCYSEQLRSPMCGDAFVQSLKIILWKHSRGKGRQSWVVLETQK